MKRRTFLIGLGACAVPSPSPALADPAFGGIALREAVAKLDAETGGRLGVAIHDRHSGARFAWRGDERFPMCSTFKALLGAAMLWRSERGIEQLDRSIAIKAGDILPNSPFSEKRAGGTASVAELCEATIALSDNLAANLLLDTMGGPAGLTRFIRRQGDAVTRLDRYELDLNEARPGDPRDTTTPDAMAGLIERLALGRALSPASRERFIAWLMASQTGLKRLRGGIPADWKAGDKTGAGNRSDNDVAIFWPPGRKPIVVASYIAGTTIEYPGSNAIHARLGTLIAVAVRSESAISA